jgi:hypothetical protein
MMRQDQQPLVRREQQWGTNRSQGLVDVLDRVLDKGLVIAGDIKIELAEVELLTIRIRLLICSIDKAQEVGLDWWKTDPHLSSRAQQPVMAENDALRKQVHDLERQLSQLTEKGHHAPARVPESTPATRSAPPPPPKREP